MKRNQRGEVMLALMAVMLVLALLGRGHMGMMGMGHAAGHAPAAVAAEQSAKGQGPAASTPKDAVEHAH